MHCWLLVIFVIALSFFRVCNDEGKGIGVGFAFGEVVEFEGDAVDSLVEYGEGVEEMGIDKELNNLSRLHVESNYIF